jgi:hypothetical protein
VPDVHLVIEDLVVERDHLMARLRATGTHRGTGDGTHRLSVLVFEAWTVRDGRCVERWLRVDQSPCVSAPRGLEPNGQLRKDHPGRTPPGRNQVNFREDHGSIAVTWREIARRYRSCNAP